MGFRRRLVWEVYGNGSYLDIGKIQIKVNNSTKEFDIPETGDFVFQIDLSEIESLKDNTFTYEYKYFDRNGTEMLRK